MRVLVTGATGFIGRKFVARLVENGFDVVAFVRESSNTAGLPESVAFVEGDLFDKPLLKKAVQSCEAVVHFAAYFDFYPKDVDLLYKVNVEGTKNLMNACVGTTVERFIYCSTTETIGPVRFPPGDEDTELNPQFDYSKSKIMAEEAIREITKDTGLHHVILRPTGVMGEGDLYTTFEAIEAVNKGELPVLPGDGEKRIMYTHVDDVVSGFAAALISKLALDNTIILSPDEPLTYNEFFAFLGDVLGVDPPKLKIPTVFAKVGIGLLSPIKNRKRTTFLWHMQTVQSMDEERWYSNEKAKKLLGWAPQVTMREGLKRAIDWYYENNYLERMAK